MSKSRVRNAGVAVLVAFAGWRVWSAMNGREGVPEKAWFHDESARRLFVAARGVVPPIRGIDAPEEDGVRAVVVAPPGRCDDASARSIAYLETTAPELKRALEEAKASGRAPAISRGAAQGLRMVRGVGWTSWASLLTPEGEALVGAWAVPGPDGATPAVCSP